LQELFAQAGLKLWSSWSLPPDFVFQNFPESCLM
jgi:hypothetical protein